MQIIKQRANCNIMQVDHPRGNHTYRCYSLHDRKISKVKQSNTLLGSTQH